MGSSVWGQMPLPAQSRIRDRADRARAHALRLAIALRHNQYTSYTAVAGVGIAALAALLAFVAHVNQPLPYLPYHDSWEYMQRANTMLSGGSWVDSIRMPGYPLLLAIVFAFTSKSNLHAADSIGYFLFVIAAIEVYVLSYRVWRNTRFAIVIGLLFATNFYFFSFFKPILSDGFATVLALAVALAVVIFLERPTAPRFWAVTLTLLALIMTRAEWYLLPIPLFLYLLFVAYRHRRALRLVPHALLATALTYGVVGLYMELNARLNGYFGLSDSENINLYGKVTQYHMQGQASARYAHIMAVTNAYVSKGTTDPWLIYWSDHALGKNHFSLMGAYARSIILSHPIEFLKDSVPVLIRSLYDAYAFGQYSPSGNFAGALHAIEAFSSVVFPLFMLFPLCALGWFILLVIRRHTSLASRFVAEAVCALSLLSLYDLVITTLGSYDEYARLHLDFDPLMLIVIVGSLFLLAGAGAYRVGSKATPPEADPPGAEKNMPVSSERVMLDRSLR